MELIYHHSVICVCPQCGESVEFRAKPNECVPAPPGFKGCGPATVDIPARHKSNAVPLDIAAKVLGSCVVCACGYTLSIYMEPTRTARMFPLVTELRSANTGDLFSK